MISIVPDIIFLKLNIIWFLHSISLRLRFVLNHVWEKWENMQAYAANTILRHTFFSHFQYKWKIWMYADGNTKRAIFTAIRDVFVHYAYCIMPKKIFESQGERENIPVMN